MKLLGALIGAVVGYVFGNSQMGLSLPPAVTSSQQGSVQTHEMVYAGAGAILGFLVSGK
jgi:hypothetical protein